MFDIGFPELLVIGLIAVLVFGPDRLPEFVRTVARLLHQVRDMVGKAQRDLREELGPDFADLDVRDLNPHSFVRKHLLDGLHDDNEQDSPSPVPSKHVAGTAAPYDHEAT